MSTARGLGLFFVCALVGALSGIAGCADGGTGGMRDASGGRGDGGDAGIGGRDGGPGMDANVDGGPIEQRELCEACTLHEQCRVAGRCAELSDGDFACLAACNPDIPSCPRGFDCVHNFETATDLCVPVGTRCCVDQDADGYGVGAGCEGPDCDDDDLDVNPAHAELCNTVDDDCDGNVDEMATDCGSQRCDGTMTGTYEQVPPSTCVDGECTEMGRTSCALYTCVDGSDSGDFCATTCSIAGVDSDAHCILAAHCDTGVCAMDLPDGDACDEPSDCSSGHCQNGFCCADGDCCGVVSDCPSVGGIGTTCDDSATCQGTRGEIACEMHQCTTRSGVPDDSACDAMVIANECGPYRAIACTGAAMQPPPSCPTSCASDAICDDAAHCDAVCIPDVEDGGLCDEDSDCVGGHCDNNVCCASGDCCRTPTDCPASYGTAPTCDSPTTCQGTRDAAICTDFVCGTAVDVADDSACTTSVEASACGLYPSRYCSGGTDQTPPVCAMGCTADADCDGPAHCDLMSCVPDLPDGQACDEASDCATGHCQNGYCCATGDCCAEASDCPFGSYGEPSICNSAMTCQGTRRDPVCNASSQCTLGPAVDDDSGCSGLLASSCGLYPSVSCTSEMAQPPDPTARCPMSCTTTADCDLGAFCTMGVCTPRGMPGDACVSSGQCQDGLNCVDGVCCTSACTGGCMACNVPGSLGTCAPVPNGQDPANECGGVSCTGYYFGWAGDQCQRRDDAPASAVSCNGSGACQGASTVCPLQGAGPVTTDCNDQCQTPNGGTCTGTTSGTCANDPAGSQSCGVGECRRTVAECNLGTPVTCTPGSPTAEICDNQDDNCDGQVDNGLSGDMWEANNACAGRFLQTLYTSGTSTQPASLSIMPTIYGSGDMDVFRVDWDENDSTCGCGGISTDEDYGLTATVSVPAGAGSYTICGNMGSCVTTTGTCTTITEGTSGAVTIWQDDCCSPFGCEGSGSGWFTVRGAGTPGYECAPYTLSVSTVRGCR